MECLFNYLVLFNCFLKDLPAERYIYGQDERYIENNFEKFEALVDTGINNDRYFNLDYVSENGYSIDKFVRLCNNDNNCCCSVQKKYILNGFVDEYVYDPLKCSRYFASEVKNWEEVCGYNILYLLGKVPGTPDHPGSWNKETELILDPLTRISRQGILTLDSQPGIVVNINNDNSNNNDNGNDNNDNDNDGNDDNYVQKPYLQIAGPVDRLYKIVKILLTDDSSYESKMIRYVYYDDELSPFELDGYVSYIDDCSKYVKIMLGVETPNILTEQYNQYILSNQFFNRIAEVIENN